MNLKRFFSSIYIEVLSRLVGTRKCHIGNIVLLEFFDRKLLKSVLYN